MEFPILGQIRSVSRVVPIVTPLLLVYYDIQLKKRESLEKAFENRGADILFSLVVQSSILKLVNKVIPFLPSKWSHWDPALYINGPIATSTLLATSLIRDYPESKLLKLGGVIYFMANIWANLNQTTTPQIVASIATGVANSFLLNKLFLTIVGTFDPFE